MSGEMFEGYAVVEMMGHRKLTGKVTPVEGFGGLLRLEVPGVEQPIIIGSGAIFQITPVSEAFARERAEDYLRQSAYYSAQHLLALLPEEKRPELVAETPREIGVDYEIDDEDFDSSYDPEGYEFEDEDDEFEDDDDFDEDDGDYDRALAKYQRDRESAIKSARELLAPAGFQALPGIRTLKEIVILYTETTGLNLDVDQPVEIAVINATGKVLFDKRIKPTISIDDGASAVHGIGLDDLADAPTFAEVHDELALVLQDKIVIVWNSDYDKAMLANAAREHHLTNPIRESLCAMKLYAQFYGEWNDYRGDYRWQKLDAACDQCGIEAATIPGGLHSALGDVQRTLAILRFMADEPLPDDADDGNEEKPEQAKPASEESAPF